MKSVLIVCTKNRPDDLIRCLNSVSKLHRRPDRVVIVDQSEDSILASFKTSLEQATSNFGNNLVHVISSSGGLTTARNEGLSLVADDEEIVHFIDDDVSILEDYFAEIERCFEDDSVVGASGLVLQREPPAMKHNFLFWVCGLTSRPGTISIFGAASGIYSSSTSETQWLPGCSMSYRKSALRGLEFDVDREISPMGEDVDFSHRVSKVGKLVAEPRAQLVHHLSPVGREKQKQATVQDFEHRLAMGASADFKVRSSLVVVAAFNRVAVYLASGVLTFPTRSGRSRLVTALQVGHALVLALRNRRAR